MTEETDKLEGYRILTIETMEPIEHGIVLKFINSGIAFSIREDAVERFQLNDLGAGNQVAVKGKSGNSDTDLWGFDVVADIKKV